jgi:hypothetical protein
MGVDYKNWDWRKTVARQLDPTENSNWVKIHLNIHCNDLMMTLGENVAFEHIKGNDYIRFSKNPKLTNHKVPYRYRRLVLGGLSINSQDFDQLGLYRRTRYTLESVDHSRKAFYLKPHSSVGFMTPMRLSVPAISIY